jgi:ABC-type transporter Mla MlaB component
MVIGLLARAEVPALCERLRVLADESNVEVVDCDVRALAADVVAVEALAHLQLTARRLGCAIRLRRPSHELVGLLDLCGLTDVLSGGALGRRRQAEEREHARRVEKRVDPRDAPV